ncbi:uncharacterized protein BX664DRAFT_388268 [Halteromyces radiatus]|uniref:uncharacterized protein n=1 Tax=Halteromyces radiatus TaxID=101107 RepID=UPI00221EA7B2|nr:uncharacterized protein BX664DRAFT_388268 [Halteromyces radiatus]KAI8083177.1 hypothetical protein BX664DRAFT_388268 [Halteromyces radiatus]
MSKETVDANETETRGIINLWKRLTLRTDSSSIRSLNHQSRHSNQKDAMVQTKKMMIYLKSPHALSGGLMKGTISLTPVPNMEIQQLELMLHGIEIVFDPVHYSSSTHAYSFLELPILTLQQPNDQLIVPANHHPFQMTIPFRFQLPLDLGGSYKDKKGCVEYTLQCHARVRIDDHDEVWYMDRHLQVYQNVLSLKSTEQMALYQPICERRRIWERSPVLLSPIISNANNDKDTDSKKNKHSFVDLTMNISRSIWTSGTCLYVTMTMENRSVHKLRDIKLELIKRENTFSQTGLKKSFDLMPVTSTCELIATTSLLNLGWWKPLDPQSDDHVLIPLEIPPHEFTIKHQKLIDISFALRISASSLTSTDAIVEIPITLAHPISADPPPGSIIVSSPTSATTETNLLPYDPSFHLFSQSHGIIHPETQSLPEPTPLPPPSSSVPLSASSPSVWTSRSLSYVAFNPLSDTPSPPPLPPKEENFLRQYDPPMDNPKKKKKKGHSNHHDHHHLTKIKQEKQQQQQQQQKIISVSSSNSLIPDHHAYSTSNQLPKCLTLSCKQEDGLLSSQTSTLLTLAPSQKFEISVKDLNLFSPPSPQMKTTHPSPHRHHGLYRLWTSKKKKTRVC